MVLLRICFFYLIVQSNCLRLVVTTIHHDSESETEVTNCNPQRCYQHALTYKVELSDIVTIIDQSEECEQYIKVNILIVAKYL